MWAESQRNVRGNIFRLYVGKINTKNKCHKHIHGCTGGWFRSSASIICCKGDTGIYPSWGFSSVCRNAVDVNGQWALTGKEVRAGSLCLLGFFQEIMKETENICETTLLSEGWGTRKTTWATLLYSGIHSCVLRSCHWEAQPKAPNELKHVSVQGKNPLRTSYVGFYKEPHVLIAWFKEKNKEKNPNLLLAGMFLLSEENLLVMLHLELIWSETESSHTLSDLNLEEQTHFAIIFIVVPATPTPGISGCTSSAFLVSRSRFL